MKKPIDANVSPRGVLKRLRGAYPGYEFQTRGERGKSYVYVRHVSGAWGFLGKWTDEPFLRETMNLILRTARMKEFITKPTEAAK